MSQSVNLLLVLETESVTSLNARRVIELSVLFCILLAFVYVATWWKTADKRTLLSSLHTEQVKVEGAVKKIKTEQEQDKSAEIMQKQLDDLIARRNAKIKVLAVLTDKGVGNIKGFSEYMRGFSEERVEGVWIRSFSIDAGGDELTIEGSTLDTSKVPILIQMLAETPAFSKRDFQDFTLTRGDKDQSVIDFTLKSKQEVAPKPAATSDPKDTTKTANDASSAAPGDKK